MCGESRMHGDNGGNGETQVMLCALFLPTDTPLAYWGTITSGAQCCTARELAEDAGIYARPRALNCLDCVILRTRAGTGAMGDRRFSPL
jgi:hypothetical protein